jgi:hypothetical protein
VDEAAIRTYVGDYSFWQNLSKLVFATGFRFGRGKQTFFCHNEKITVQTSIRIMTLLKLQ